MPCRDINLDLHTMFTELAIPKCQHALVKEKNVESERNCFVRIEFSQRAYAARRDLFLEFAIQFLLDCFQEKLMTREIGKPLAILFELFNGVINIRNLTGVKPQLNPP